MIRHFDAFSGYGGFSIALHDFVETVGFSEVDKYANSVLRYRFPNIKNYGDVCAIDSKHLPDFDLLTGGSPCQDFSIAGQRKGIVGERSGLFFQFIRLLKEKQPRNFIFENVKGVLSAHGGWDIGRMQIEISEAGYDCQWQVLNARDFGIPQNRERIFIVGTLRGESFRQIFSLVTSLELYRTKNGNSEAEGERVRGESCGAKDCVTAITQNYHKGVHCGGETYVLQQLGNIDQKGHNSIWGRVYSPDGIAPTLNSEGGGLGAKTGLFLVKDWKFLTERRTEEAKEIRRKTMKEEGRDYCPRRGKELVAREDGVGNCVTATQGKEQLLTDGFRIRRLTPLECERLMGLEDGWTKIGIDESGKQIELSDVQRYRLCGNGIVVNVVREIGKLLFQESESETNQIDNRRIG